MRMPRAAQVRLVTHKLASDISLELPVVLCRTISSSAVGYPVAPDFWKPQVRKWLGGEEWTCGGGTAQRGRMRKGAVSGVRGREGG